MEGALLDPNSVTPVTLSDGGKIEKGPPRSDPSGLYHNEYNLNTFYEIPLILSTEKTRFFPFYFPALAKVDPQEHPLRRAGQ